MNSYEYLVIGAGPAGLAFASSINNPSVLVVDLGKPVEARDRFNPQECIQGAGGAGLFSDGKFSFYPSGTVIWEQEIEPLQGGYKMLTKELSRFKHIPPFPEINNHDKLEPNKAGWHLKSYESIYLSLNERIELIHNLAEKCLKIQYQTEFLRYSEAEGGYKIDLRNTESGLLQEIRARKIVCAGGRFMPLFLECTKQFRRYEFGFRVEGPSHIIQKEVKLVDPKYIFSDQKGEYRTFCWCDQGEVVKTTFKDIHTYSGRADCEPTNKSNFGFNIRVRDPAILSQDEFKSLMYTKAFKEKFKNLNKVTDTLPSSAEKLIELGIAKLIERFPGLNCNDVEVIGPTIEGVGHYPTIDSNFCLKEAPNIHVIGDCSGLYRGIVASMLSGYILAYSHNLKMEK